MGYDNLADCKPYKSLLAGKQTLGDLARELANKYCEKEGTMEEQLKLKKVKKVIIECEDGSTYAGDAIRMEGSPFNFKGVFLSVIVGEQCGFLGIDRVIYDNPATIVYWTDGTRTVVNCMDNLETVKKTRNGKEITVKKPRKCDTYSKEIGLAMCIAKKHFGNAGNYNDVFRKFGAIEGGENK